MPTSIALLVLGASLPLGASLVIDAVAHLFQVSPGWGAFWTKVTGRARGAATLGSTSTSQKRRLGLAATLAWMQALAAVMQLANQGMFTVLVTVPASDLALPCVESMLVSSFWFIIFQTIAVSVVIVRATGMLPNVVVAAGRDRAAAALWRRPRKVARAVLFSLLSISIGFQLHSGITKAVTVDAETGLCATIYPWTNNAAKLVMVLVYVLVSLALIVPLTQHLQRLRDHAPALLSAATPAATAANSNSTAAPNSKVAPTSATGSPGITARRASTGTALAASSPGAAAVSSHATTMALVEAILHDQAMRFALVVLCYLLTAVLSIAGAWPASLSVVSFTLQNYLCMLTATARVTTVRPGMSAAAAAAAAPSNSTGGTGQGSSTGGNASASAPAITKSNTIKRGSAAGSMLTGLVAPRGSVGASRTLAPSTGDISAASAPVGVAKSTGDISTALAPAPVRVAKSTVKMALDE
ncbi:hypothetical protein GGF32_001835 [Allomyces javanicus]|nr:hypothetical protein GGF32_001835 [Allomyces javanicus]